MTFSQVGQDDFVVESLNKKRDGYFLDVGAAMPIQNNNTYLLEKEYGWTGLLFELDPQYLQALQSQRNASVVFGDATKLEYQTLLESYSAPKIIDYLSLDLDPAAATLIALEKLLETDYMFRCITFEHDSYRYGDSIKHTSKKLLIDKGYTIAKEDVDYQGQPFEDWYICQKLV